MGEMSGGPGLVDVSNPRLIHQGARLLLRHNGPTKQCEETVVVSCGHRDMIGEEALRRLPDHRLILGKYSCRCLSLCSRRLGEKLIEPAQVGPQVHNDECFRLLIHRSIDHMTQIPQRLCRSDVLWRS